ncbi:MULTISPECIES: site-specific integrase [unclassified Bradyrhizobium]|uniref:tyrosine-type recombinase/integrase n=1 Tax=unclassified Bradyrhizobium TaxID=2631580 RepID=UPI001FF7D01E|nr:MULTISPECIES: site-specific integrase [unclassified Bradyrhizobium]
MSPDRNGLGSFAALSAMPAGLNPRHHGRTSTSTGALARPMMRDSCATEISVGDSMASTSSSRAWTRYLAAASRVIAVSPEAHDVPKQRKCQPGRRQHGRIVAVHDPKTIEVLELRVGYVKDRFGKLCRQDIKRPDVLAFMRSYEAEGKLETRDRVRSIGEQICNYADVEGDGYNPFRNLNGQMIANISTPRPGVTEPRDVTRVFKLISAPWTRARFSDVVGLALRFDALTIPRPGMVNEMEWSEVDWDAERWTIPAAKMKTGWDHVVPLSRQALAILRSVQKLTGHRRYAFSCSKDAPLSNNTLNKRLRLLGIDTKTDHCAHGFRTTFSTLSHHEEIKDAKAWDGDVVELQLAHLDNSTVEGLYKRHGPLALIGSRTKLMQHWADRIDHWLDPKKVMPIKRGAQA